MKCEEETITMADKYIFAEDYNKQRKSKFVVQVEIVLRYDE